MKKASILTICFFLLLTSFSCSNKKIISKSNQNTIFDRYNAFVKSKTLINLKDIPDLPNTNLLWKTKEIVRSNQEVELMYQNKLLYTISNVRDLEWVNKTKPKNKSYNRLIAIDPNTGKEVWKFETEDPIFDHFTVTKQHVFIGCGTFSPLNNTINDYIISFDALTGKENWKTLLGENIPEEIKALGGNIDSLKLVGGIQTWSNQVILMVNVNISYPDFQEKKPYYVLCLDMKTGSQLWSHVFPENEKFDYATVFKVFGDQLFISNGDPHTDPYVLYSIELTSYQVQKISNLMIQDFIVHQSKAYFLSNRNPYLVGEIDLKSRKIQWGITLPLFNIDDLENWTSFTEMFLLDQWLVAHDIYHLTGINLMTKNIQWNIQLDHNSFHSKIAQYKGILYFSVGPPYGDVWDTHMVAFDISTHQFLWKWKIPRTDNAVYMRNGPYFVNNTLYFGCSDGNLYALPLNR